MGDESKRNVTDYSAIFIGLDIEEFNALERIYCMSGETFARELSKSNLDLKDPADYCRAVINRSIDFSATNTDMFDHRSLLSPYLLILEDKGYAVNEESAEILRNYLIADVTTRSEDKTTASDFDPFNLGTPHVFKVTPGVALDVGAVEAAQTNGRGVDISPYKGPEGNALLMSQATQCFLNNEDNLLDPDAPKPEHPMTFEGCYDVGRAMATLHLRPDLAENTIETQITPIGIKSDTTTSLGKN